MTYLLLFAIYGGVIVLLYLLVLIIDNVKDDRMKCCIIIHTPRKNEYIKMLRYCHKKGYKIKSNLTFEFYKGLTIFKLDYINKLVYINNRTKFDEDEILYYGDIDLNL